MAKRHDDIAVSQKTSSVRVMSVNRQHKDTFFKEVYAAEKRQRELASFLLGLDVKQVSTANIRPVLFGNKENDLAFTCDDIVYVMTECQAKVSPNITYRLSEYIITGLRAMVDSEELLYGSSRVYFPIPKLYVLQVGLETRESRLPDCVMYDMRLSESYKPPKDAYKKQGIAADLEATVHIYDFRMTLAEICQYIEDESIPARFSDYANDMRNYAFVANGITYIQRAVNDRTREYVMPANVSKVTDYLELLKKRDIFVDLLSNKEVCDMTLAQFSRDDMLIYQGREEGREEGRHESISRFAETYFRHNQSAEEAYRVIAMTFPDVDSEYVKSVIREVYQ